MTYKIAEKKRLAQRARASRQRASLPEIVLLLIMLVVNSTPICLLYTSDAADE